MINFLDLQIPVHPFKDDYPIDLLKEKRHIKINFEDILTEKFINLLDTLSIKVSLVESFYSPKSIIQPIHIDSKGGDYTKLNFVYGGKDSLMHWYKLKEGSNAISHITDIGTIYATYNRQDCIILESHCIKFPTLIQAGVPHNVTNPPFEDRLCISLFLRDKNTNEIIDMKNAIHRFQNYLVPQMGLEPTKPTTST